MNNLISFWLAPVTALFHPRVYRDAAKSSGGRGVLYALYLSLIAVVLVMILLAARVAPVTDDLAGWLQKNMPVVIWTPQGIVLENGQTAVTLRHPQYGPIAKLDLTKKVVTEADFGDGFLFVTATRVYIKRGPGQIEDRDITQAGMQTGQRLPPRIRITGDITGQLYKNIKHTLGVVIPLILFFIIFLSILLANVFYSLVGLLLNLGRKQKLGYGAVFTLTCFATTVSFTLSWLRFVLPVAPASWPVVVNILISLAYIVFAFKLTDREAEAK